MVGPILAAIGGAIAAGAARGFPLLRGAAGLVGGAVAQRRQDKLQREIWQREDSQLQRLMKDAAAAGIHPVAALGAGANYGSSMGIPGSPLGDAIGEAGLRISDSVAESNRLALDRQRLELEGLALDNDSRRLMLAEAQSRTLMSQALSGLRAPTSAIVETPTAAVVGGRNFEIGAAGPYTPSRVAEDIYGEPGEWLFGGYNLARDIGANFRNAVHARFPGLAELSFNDGPLGHVYVPWPPWDAPQPGRNHPDRFFVFDR